MTPSTQEVDVAGELCRELIAADFGPFFGTPCEILSPLHTALDQEAGVLTVARACLRPAALLVPPATFGLLA